MQTFLPYQNFVQSAKCLDYKRLGKQRLEAREILAINLNKRFPDIFNLEFLKSNISLLRYDAHRKHPAVLMWEGHEFDLLEYGCSICLEWGIRGYNDQQLLWFNDTCAKMIKLGNGLWTKFEQPEEFHSSHRAALLYKNYEWYKQFGWIEEPKLEYWWPSKLGKENSIIK